MKKSEPIVSWRRGKGEIHTLVCDLVTFDKCKQNKLQIYREMILPATTQPQEPILRAESHTIFHLYTKRPKETGRRRLMNGLLPLNSHELEPQQSANKVTEFKYAFV